MNTKKHKSNNWLILVYVITASVAFISRIGYTVMPAFITYSISILWIVLALLNLLKNKFKLSDSDLEIKKLLLLFLIPKIIVHLYSIILFLINKTDYVTRNTRTYIIILAAFSVLYLLKKDTIKYTLVAAVLSFTFVITYNVLNYGIQTIPEILIFMLTKNEQYSEHSKLYEVHDYTFALGYIIIYYLLVKDKFTKLDLIYCYIFIIFTILGFKRIQFLAILLVLIYALISKFIYKKYKFYKYTSYMNIAIAYMFIFSLKSGYFFELIDKLNINTMGRVFYYKSMIDLCQFNPMFLGMGRNWTSYAFMNQYSYLRVGGVHSDILKYFVECGFLLFGFWLWFYLVKILKWLMQRYDNKVVFCYQVMTLYTFILYYTDNTETYFISQFIYMIIIVGTVLNFKKNIEVKNEQYY